MKHESDKLQEIKKAFEDALNAPSNNSIDYFLQAMLVRINNEIELTN
mgnify:CR=1 FL=1